MLAFAQSLLMQDTILMKLNHEFPNYYNNVKMIDECIDNEEYQSTIQSSNSNISINCRIYKI